MSVNRGAVTAVLALLLACSDAGAAITSTFDSDAEGWREFEYTNPGVFLSDVGPADYDGAFGNPDPAGNGSVSTLDPGGGTAARIGAPAAYLGNKSGFKGGVLEFDLIIKANDGVKSLPVVPGMVLIENAAANLALAYTGEMPVFGSWTHYVVPLAPNPGAGSVLDIGFWAAFPPDTPGTNAATQADFDAVFANITRLSINGEVTDGTDDVIALDNVNLVPVPAALPLMAGALLGVWGAGRRRS